MTTKPNTRTAAKSYAHRHGMNLRRKAIYVAVASCFSVTPAFAATNLAGYNYVTKLGSVTSDNTINNIRTLNIANDLRTNAAILNWKGGLNVNAGETLNLNQLNSSSKLLNRIGGGNATNILGTLNSNGKVYLINNSGIVFGKGSTIAVDGGLVASSLNITNSDFIKGNNNFYAKNAPPGGVTNDGAITTKSGGFVYLIAPQVTNGTNGVITTPNGEAILASGNSVQLVDSADPSLRVVVKATTRDINLSQLMTQSNGQIFSVLNSGKISANSAVVGQNGKIQLRSAGNLTTTSTSVLEAKGTTSTNGGLIRGFANGTGTYAGKFDISGRNGGKLETSAAVLKLDPNIAIVANAMTPGGHGGTWLLDPYNYTIGATEAGIINNAFSSSGVGTITIDSSSASSFGISGVTGVGNISVQSAINAGYAGGGSNYAQTLNLYAYGSVVINAPITNSAGSKLSVNIYADEDNSGNDGGIAFNKSINVGGAIDAETHSGNITMSGASTLLQSPNIDLDAFNGNIGSATSYINTNATDLTVGHFGGSQAVHNAYITDSAAVDDATLYTDGIASLFLSGGVLSDTCLELYGTDKVVTSSTGLTMNRGHITFYGGGVGTVKVAGDLNMASGAYIGNDSTSDGGKVKVAANNLNMDNSYIEGGSDNNANGDVVVNVSGSISMVNNSHIDTADSQGGIDVEAGAISLLNSTIETDGSYAGDILVVASNLQLFNNSKIGDLGNPQGDTVIFAHDVTVSSGSKIQGDNVGINFDPDGISSFNDVKNLPAIDTFFKTATVTVSYGGGINSDHGLGIVTGKLTVTTSDGNGHDSDTSINSGESMALFTAGDLSIKGGNTKGGYGSFGYGAGIFVGDELFLKVGGKLTLNSSSDGTGSAVLDVDSNQTLFMDFPFVQANGWSVDGVNNAFTSSVNSNTGITVGGGGPAIIGTNTFINYGDGVTSTVVGAIKSFQAGELLKGTSTNNNNTTTASSTSDAIFGGEEDDGKGGKNKKSAPKQCS